MVDGAITSLGPSPVDWGTVEMWRFVNEVDAARRSGALGDGEHVLAVRADVGARPVHLAFTLSARVAEHGWSWANHYHDEQVEIAFLPETVVVRLNVGANKILISRAIVILAIVRYFSNTYAEVGTVIRCSLGDSDGDNPILCFSSKSFDDYLIPDPYFMLTRSYEQEREKLLDTWLDFKERDPRMYWRGATSGLAKYVDQFESQRVKLVMLANDPSVRKKFNVRFANRDGLEEGAMAAIEARDGFGAPEEQMEIARYSFNIDVDGVSSSWTGLFLKLLAGGVVVKIASDAGYRQWYYSNFQPWVHYAEVASDLSDFNSVGRLLNIRRDLAQNIAETGRVFALSLDLYSQLIDATKAVERAIRNKY